MINFLCGFLFALLFVVVCAIFEFFIKKRKAKKVIKDTIDGCGDINELISQLNQVKKIFNYENLNENEVEKND